MSAPSSEGRNVSATEIFQRLRVANMVNHINGTMVDTWEPVPLLHWRYWSGFRMRRLVWDAYSIGGRYDGEYEYATHEQCAKKFLEETYG